MHFLEHTNETVTNFVNSKMRNLFACHRNLKFQAIVSTTTVIQSVTEISFLLKFIKSGTFDRIHNYLIEIGKTNFLICKIIKSYARFEKNSVTFNNLLQIRLT